MRHNYLQQPVLLKSLTKVSSTFDGLTLTSAKESL